MISLGEAALSVERRLRSLGAPEDEDDGIQDAASRAAAQRFLSALGFYSKPAVFVLPCGHFRLVWLKRDDGGTEQFAVSFTGRGRANVVYTDPHAVKSKTKKRMTAGGFVAVEIAEKRLIAMLLESGHDEHVRKGMAPTR